MPPPRFTTGDLLENDVDFCYGSYYNSLWLFIDKIHNLNLRYDHSQEAINQRKEYLIKHKIGVCDIVERAERQKIDASDIGMTNIKLRDVIGYLKQYPSINTLLFTGGNSKNGPEYFFRKHLRDYSLKLKLVSNETPRIHEFELDYNTKPRPLSEVEVQSLVTERSRSVKTVSLTSSSGAANISISRNPLYKQLKASNPDFNTFDFRIMQYREFF